MLGEVHMGYEITAEAYRDGETDKDIVILAKMTGQEKYVTACKNHPTDKEWYSGMYFEGWDAVEKSWQSFVSRASAE